MIDTVLLDLDGTIINTNELIIQSFIHVFKEELQLEVTAEHIIPQMGRPLREQFRFFSGREDVEDLVTAYRTYNFRVHDELIQPFPYVQEVLAQLHAHGIKMAAVTSKIRRTSELGLKACGDLGRYIPYLVTVEDVVNPKPHPEPVMKALAVLDADPGRTLMVGDSSYDIMAAKAAGVRSVGVAWTLKGPEYLMAQEPDHLIHDMRELYELVGIRGEAS